MKLLKRNGDIFLFMFFVHYNKRIFHIPWIQTLSHPVGNNNNNKTKFKFIQVRNSLYFCDTRIKNRYMNKLKSHLNENNPENMMTKKSLKNMKVTIYINNVHLPFQRLNHRNFMVKHALLGACEWRQVILEELVLAGRDSF